MLFKNKKEKVKTFNREEMYPVIRSSICTGEKVAGFKHRDNGQFEEIMLIRDEHDRSHFLKLYGIREDEIKTEY